MFGRFANNASPTRRCLGDDRAKRSDHNYLLQFILDPIAIYYYLALTIGLGVVMLFAVWLG